MIPALATPFELAAELGKSMRLARAAQGLRQEDLALRSQASLQAIKNLENGGRVELVTFLRVASALGMAESVLESCQPAVQSLNDIERIEAARTQGSRVRPKA
jgi:transcriptional regulator with XRE-family HTH domain